MRAMPQRGSRGPRAILVWAGAILVATLFAAPLALGLPQAAHASVDDFEFESFHASYQLDTDDAGHSTLHTTETLVAIFPEHDQNRGIKRAIPNRYRDFPTHLEVLSVTDETGAPRPFEIAIDGDFDVVTIAVPEGEFVHGAQTYVIEYVQQDVTAFFEDIGRDEFYWDVNGTGWAQPFHQASAELRIAPELVQHLTGDVACYRGSEGSTNRCQVERVDDKERGTRFTLSTTDLAAHENATLAVGFDPAAFVDPEPGFIQKHAFWLTLSPIAAAMLLGGIVLVMRRTAWKDAPRAHAVTAQYEQPKGVDLFTASELVGKRKRAAVSTMLDFAVRGNARILQYRVPGGTKAIFGIQALTSDGLTPPEKLFAAALFASKMADGPTTWFNFRSQRLAEGMVECRKEARRKAFENELRQRPTATSYVPVILAALTVLAAQALALTVLMIRFSRDYSLIWPTLAGLAASTAAGFLLAYAFRRAPLTVKGRKLHDHLQGLGEFIRLTEADRLAMLQSVSGASRIAFRSPAGFTGSGPLTVQEAVTEHEFELAVVHLYERLLPYAAIFGVENQWVRTLSLYYSYVQPGWILLDDRSRISDLGSHLGEIANDLTAFATSMSTTYSGSQHAASTGGSGGGGSSGGGGGGGGGGGV